MSLINKLDSILSSKSDLDKVKYTPNRVDYDENLSILDIDWKNILKDPPKNSSAQTAKEINAVAESTKSRTRKELDLIYTVDEEPLDLFYKFLSKKTGYSFPVALFYDYFNILEQYIYALKYHFNRARPEQIAPYYNLDIEVFYTDTHETPSYPSGHTMYSELAAHILSDIYPEYRNDFFKLSEYCALARILQGVHFPSDNVASVVATRTLYPKIKEYYDNKRTKENPINR